MAHAVSLVMIDIVKSYTIHKRLSQKVGTKADAQYDQQIKIPCRQRVIKLLAEHSGILHGDVGDLFTAHFDHTQDAVAFALAVQRLMSSEPIAVPEGCDCPHLQLHVAVGRGSMEDAAYRNPGAASVGAFNQLARILAITGNDQTLVTVDAKESAGEVEGVAWHAWDVVLPKEEDRVKVRELLWDGREPRRPKDIGAAVARVETQADAGDPAAQEAIQQARSSEDPAKLQDVLRAQRDRREKQVREYATDWIELNRELAAVAFVRGDINVATEALQKVLALAKDDLDATNRLGNIYRMRGDLAAAEEQYNRLRSIAPDDELWNSKALGNLGVIARTRGDLDAAEKLHGESLEIDRKLGRLEGQAVALGNLGVIARTRGDLDAAEKLHRESLGIDRKLGRLEGQAVALGNLGLIAMDRGDLDAAEKLYNESLEINRKLGRPEGQAINLGNLGLIAQTRGDLDVAEKLHGEALELNRKLGRLEGQGIALVNLSDMERDRDRPNEAVKLANEALRLFESLNHKEGQAEALASLGSSAKQEKDFAGARRLWTLSRDLFVKLAAKHKVKQLQGWLDGLPPE